MMARLRLAATLLLVAAPASAQSSRPPSGKCAFDVKFDRVSSIQLPSGQRNNFFGGNVVASCPSQRLTLKSDSLEIYGDEGRFFFVGHVNYAEPRLKLTSDFLTYFQREERLLAFSNVDTKLPTGSTLKGNQLEFFRAIPKIRPQQKGVALGRPTITIIDRDPQGRTQPPMTVTGNTIWLESDSIVSSQGEVVVVRPELTATGDSLYLDGGKGLLRLMRSPRIRGTKGRPFTLVGETVDLLSRRRKLERVLSKSGAEAVSEDLTLRADSIDLRISDDLLQRAIAWGSGRARATSPTQAIVSDSIDVLMPGQRVREMHAVRKATAEGTPDTTKFGTTNKDRLTGDTIVAYFDSIPARDTVTKPRISRLVAIAGPSTRINDYATALSHFAPRDTTLRLPAINYVRGQLITVTFESALVKKVDVTAPDPAGGIYLEPDPVVLPAPAPAGTAPSAAQPPGTPAGAGTRVTPATPATPPRRP